MNENSFTNESKSSKKGLIIGIVLIILLVSLATVCFIISSAKKNSTGSDTPSNEQNNEQNNEQVNEDVWDYWKLEIDGVEINLPMKYEDFIALGFDFGYSEAGINFNYFDIEPKSTFGTASRHSTTYTNGTTNSISLVLYNPLDETIKVKDSIVIGIELTYNTYMSKYGNIKMTNTKTNKTVVFNESTKSEVEEAFGEHYKFDSAYSFNYYPETVEDNTKVNWDNFLTLNFSNGVLVPGGLYYTNKTGVSKIKVVNNGEIKWNIPDGYTLTHSSKYGTEKDYNNGDYYIGLHVYWPYVTNYDVIKRYFANKDSYKNKGKAYDNEKYGDIFILEDIWYDYKPLYTYYVIVNDAEYLVEVRTKLKDQMDYDKVLNIGLSFLPR